MSKIKEADPAIIPSNEFKEELEKDVKFYTTKALLVPQLVVKKKYTPNKYPTKFRDKGEELEYQMEEIRRIIHGYDGLCGKGYGWLNYAKIRDPERGKISPQFRSKQEQYFRKVEELQKKDNTGIVGFKRRRWGFSSIAAWDVEHDCMTKPFFQIGMSSKTESDTRLLFRHVKFAHQNLPDWLRPRATAAARADFMQYGWYEKSPAGDKIAKGMQSWINCEAPTPTSHEGQAYSKLYIDEGGKLVYLEQMWATGEDCLRLNTRRVGLPIIMGTVGDIDKDGKGLKELYMNNEAYDLERFPVMGYNGLIMDEYGNCDIENSVRWIIYQRDKMKESSQANRMAFIQKYPLDERDAFNQVTGGGVGDMRIINDQIMNLIQEPPMSVTGRMRRKPEGGVDFVPDPNGKIIVYDRPDDRVNGYIGITDPVEDDDVKKSRDSSDMATLIGAKTFGLQPNKIAARYVDRPLKLDDYYEQVIMLLEWYNHTKITIEMNKGGWRMRKYFEEHAPKLLGFSPVAATSAKGGVEMRIGVKMTAERKSQMMGLMEDYIDNKAKFIPDIKLLEQHKVFGDDHADDDLAIAWGWFLIICQSDRSIAKARGELTNLNPSIEYVRNRNGFATKVNGKYQKNERSNKPKSAIFRH